MSALTKQKLAQETVEALDAILRKWTAARKRGDIGKADGGAVLDGLLEARQAACLYAPPEKEQMEEAKA